MARSNKDEALEIAYADSVSQFALMEMHGLPTIRGKHKTERDMAELLQQDIETIVKELRAFMNDLVKEGEN